MTSTELVVRDAVKADLPAVVEIYNAAIPGRMATADTEPIAAHSRQAWFDEHHPARRPLWVASIDGAVVGWLSFQTFYGRPAYRATAEVSISGMAARTASPRWSIITNSTRPGSTN